MSNQIFRLNKKKQLFFKIRYKILQDNYKFLSNSLMNFNAKTVPLFF
jgi:hypothetical protein